MVLLRLGGRWRGHFCRTLHVAMQSGPYLHPVSRVSGVWPLRIPISSVLDFRRFIRLGNVRNLDESVTREVSSFDDQIHTLHKLEKVNSL